MPKYQRTRFGAEGPESPRRTIRRRHQQPIRKRPEPLPQAVPWGEQKPAHHRYGGGVETDRERSARHEKERKEANERAERERKEANERATQERKAANERATRERKEEHERYDRERKDR